MSRSGRILLIALAVIGVAAPSFAQTETAPGDLKAAAAARMSDWFACEKAAARSSGQNDQYEILAPDKIVYLSYRSCGTERAAWIEGQMALGVSQTVARTAATAAEDCVFPALQSLVVLVRKHAPDKTVKTWLDAHKEPGCAQK